jgi:hypothetical protein
MTRTAEEFLGLVTENPVVAGLLQRLPALGLEQCYLTNGLEDMWDGILRMNPLNIQIARFHQKAEDYRSRWPWLMIQR